MIKILIVAGPGAEIHEFFGELNKSRNFQCSITYLAIPEKI
ncbi:MAG: hypothetical protein ACTSVU_01230 [Promethearchaeota archaeon]